MKTHNVLQVLAFTAVANGRPMLGRREVPQEHSHQMVLTSVQASLLKNNPADIKDSVFGLLDNAAGSAGKGTINDTDCLQQATADQAFTNAKAVGDVVGMTMALVYRALERNTGKVGLASANCTSVQAVNPEVAAVWQHQDPASPGAAANNKAVTLALARQIQAIGGNATSALLASTFAPGKTTDPTAKGNSCNSASDSVGCAFSQNLIIPDATLQEIRNATSGITNSTSTNATAILGSANSTATTPLFANGTSVAANGTANSTVSSGSAQQSGSSLTQGSSNGTTNTNGGKRKGHKGGKKNNNNNNGNTIIAEQISTETIIVNGQAEQITQITETIIQQLTNGKNGKKGNGNKRPGASAAGTAVSPAAARGTGTSTLSPSNATSGAANSTATNSTTAATGSLNLGSCTNTKIVFGPGFDGRKENSFQPADKTQFTHGSALDIGTITGFMRDRLKDTCKAPQATLDLAETASKAADSQTGQAAADTWNKALGSA